MSKPTELEVSYAILLKLAGSKEEANKLIETAREALKPEPKKLPKISASGLAKAQSEIFGNGK